jgi:hypothetical protein
LYSCNHGGCFCSHCVDTKMAEIEPRPIRCRHCDFGTGQRGMDRCPKCDGTGSQLVYRGRLYPNTKEGYDRAIKEGGK